MFWGRAIINIMPLVYRWNSCNVLLTMQHASTHTQPHTHAHTQTPAWPLCCGFISWSLARAPGGPTHVCFLYVYSAAVTVNECHHCTSILVFFQKKTDFSTFFSPWNIFCCNATDCCPVADPFSCVSGSLEVKWAAYNWIYTNDIMAGTVSYPLFQSYFIFILDVSGLVKKHKY